MKRARLRARDLVLICGQIGLLWLVSWFGHVVVDTLNIPLPGNVAAVLLMFALLHTGLVPIEFVERSATLLLRHLGLFFMPIAVGLMTFAALWISSGLSILATLLLSAAVGFVVTGRLCQSFVGLASAPPARVALSSHGSDLDRN